jgi:hypothetical protein
VPSPSLKCEVKNQRFDLIKLALISIVKQKKSIPKIGTKYDDWQKNHSKGKVSSEHNLRKEKTTYLVIRRSNDFLRS